MFRKCCVLSCSSIQDAVLMHKIPRSYDRQRLWLSIIDNRKLDNLKDSQYCYLKVCEKHFEKRFKTRFRLRYGAYPTLFTPEEISQGVPKNTPKIEGMFCKFDRAYPGNSVHKDHSYVKDELISQSAGTVRKPESSSDTAAASLDTEATEGTANDEAGCENDDCVDFQGPQESQTERVDLTKELFSWQKKQGIIAEDDFEKPMGKSMVEDDVVEVPDAEPDQTEDISMYQDDEPSFAKNVPVPCTDTGYVCNECGINITGFRYTCVQCADWDLCGACEARTAHATHYVLRVPSPRPYKEMQTVLAAIRHQLLSENLFVPEMTDGTKVEVKDEPEDPAAREEPADPDPLASLARDPCDVQNSDLKEESESLNQSIEEIESDDDDPSSRKRPRSASPANTEQDVSHSPPHEETMSTCDSAIKMTVNENQTRKIASDNVIRTLAPANRTRADIYQTRKIASDNLTRTFAPAKRTRADIYQTRKIASDNLTRTLATANPTRPDVNQTRTLATVNPTRADVNQTRKIARDNLTRTLATANRTRADINQTRTLATANQTRPDVNQTRKITDDEPAISQDPPPRKVIGINNITGEIIYHQRKSAIVPKRSVVLIPQKQIGIGSVIYTAKKPVPLLINQQTSATSRLDDPPLPTKKGAPNRLPSIIAKEKPKRQLLRIPEGTDPSHIVRALKSKVSVRIETIEKCKR